MDNITWGTFNLVTKSTSYTATYHKDGNNYDFEITGYWVRDEGWEVDEIAWVDIPENEELINAQVEMEFLTKMGGEIRALKYKLVE
jgi:hypothetical protein